MPLYEIQETAQRGQVLLVSTDKRGVCPVVSIQLPEKRAKQILAALDFVDSFGKVTENELDFLLTTNTRQSLIGCITAAAKITGMPIEKS